MKRLIPCMLLLPLLSSCVSEGYYEPGYYPPPPQVEIHRYEEHRHYEPGYRHYHGHRPAPQARVYQAPGNTYGNAHGHGSTRGGQAVVVSPHQPQARPQPQMRPQSESQVIIHQHAVEQHN